MFWLALACSPCPEGFVADGGACVPDTAGVEPVELDERGHPPCEPREPGTRLGLEQGCVDGACDGVDYAGWVGALGAEGSCDTSDVVPETTFCSWQGGNVDTHFVDEDLDGAPDDGAVAEGAYVSEGWSGSDADGLGLGISLACFYEVLGEPQEEDRVPNGSAVRVVDATWTLPSGATVFVHDLELLEEPDGHVGRLSLFAP